MPAVEEADSKLNRVAGLTGKVGFEQRSRNEPSE